MLKEDNDIKNIDDDVLNRANFAKSLALNIQNYFNRQDINNCLTIGLMGEWGSGKTSLLNMTEKYLKDYKIKIIKFNPWLYSSYNQLVGQFFDELILEFTDSRDVSLSGFLRQYKIKVNELELAKKLAVVGTSLIDSRLGSGVERILGSFSEEENLTYLKKKIDEQFSGRKVVCIIDDLDRLSKDEIAEMFKLIKIMADFKNMIYLVSFDKDVVSEALEKDYGGEKYIEKIINVPLYVPLITTQELTDLLLDEVKRLQEQYKLKIDYSRLKSFINFYPMTQDKKFGVIHFFKNLRDVKRFINILEFNIVLIKDEVNFADFFALTALQVFHLNIYNKIKYNEYLLTDHHYYDGVTISKDEIIESKKEDFEKFCDDENITLILKKLFPMMNYIYDSNHYNFHFKNFDEQLLICHPKHFKSYFKLDDVVKVLPEKEVNILVEMINSKESVDEIFNNLNDLGLNKITLFFEYMLNRLERIVKKRYFIKILFLVEERLGSEVYNCRYTPRNIQDLIVNLLYKIDKNCRFEILKENFELCDNFDLLCYLWRYINENNYNIYVADEEILSSDELDYLRQVLKDKLNITEIVPWDSSKFIEIMTIYEILDLTEINDTIISNSLITAEDVLSFLNIFNHDDKKSNSSRVYVGEMKKYCNIEIIKNKVDDLPPEYNEEQVVKSFLMGYELINE